MLYVYCIMFKDGYVICMFTKFTVGFINTFSKASLSLSAFLNMFILNRAVYFLLNYFEN